MSSTNCLRPSRGFDLNLRVRMVNYTEEIRKQFNIVNDFTPEEEAQVREENRWCEDA